jgi:hypothetical protein
VVNNPPIGAAAAVLLEPVGVSAKAVFAKVLWQKGLVRDPLGLGAVVAVVELVRAGHGAVEKSCKRTT